jgi:hypothetical protein
MIYKCLSWDGDQQQDMGKPSLKIANPSHRWEVVSVPSPVVSDKTQSTLRKEQGWTHSLWVLRTLGRSRMYEIMC